MTQNVYANNAGVARETAAYDNLIVGDHVQTMEALITGAVAYSRGDILKLTPTTNVVVPAIAADLVPTNVLLISVHTLTAAEATTHAATGRQLQHYSQGEYAAELLTLSGVALTAPQILAAKAAFAAQNIEIRSTQQIY
jgi:hypothetical protein